MQEEAVFMFSATGNAGKITQIGTGHQIGCADMSELPVPWSKGSVLTDTGQTKSRHYHLA